MHRGHYFGALALACVCLASASVAWSEPAPIRQIVVPYSLKSSLLENRSVAESVVFSEVVQGGDVPWMRLAFGNVRLAPGSRLEITSLLDGATQTLTAATLGQWQYTSAYFNGSAVRLSLIAAGGSRHSSST